MNPATNNLVDLPQKLGVSETWIEKGGTHWLTSNALDVRVLARTMKAWHARFVTITATELAEGQGIRLEYHWDLDGQLLGFPFIVSATPIESIFDLCEAADWIEREIHEYYNLDFQGREYEPLFLRSGHKPGVNLREVDE
jgi:Respiratory-chain NADH dehydrogenase, 30 Kd subunit